ncbi:MAG: hypothetical protein AAGA68_07145 [Pseudomonadota bacterium]
MHKSTISSVADLSRHEMAGILELAAMEKQLFSEFSDAAKGMILGLLFFQPSTRNRLSFGSSFLRLGGNTVGFSSLEESRSGETAREGMEDLARVVSSFCDFAAMRTPDEAQFLDFANAAEVPVVSAGHGRLEHPTAGMTHLYMLTRLLGSLDGLRILAFDHSPTRTTNSIILALATWTRVHVDVVSSTAPSKWLVQRCEHLGTVLRHYPRFEEVEDSQTLKEYHAILFDFVGAAKGILDGEFRLTKETIKRFDPEVAVLHPLPRDERLAAEIDDLPNARYFEVVKHANYVRAAIFIKRLVQIS